MGDTVPALQSLEIAPRDERRRGFRLREASGPGSHSAATLQKL